MSCSVFQDLGEYFTVLLKFSGPQRRMTQERCSNEVDTSLRSEKQCAIAVKPSFHNSSHSCSYRAGVHNHFQNWSVGHFRCSTMSGQQGGYGQPPNMQQQQVIITVIILFAAAQYHLWGSTVVGQLFSSPVPTTLVFQLRERSHIIGLLIFGVVMVQNTI